MDKTAFNLYNLNSYDLTAGFSPGFSPMSNPFMSGSSAPMFDFSNSFTSGNPYACFNNDFMASNLSMFDAYINYKMPQSQMNKIFDTNFNTKTNLPQLEKFYNANLGNSLANIAYKNASAKNSRHKCLEGVRESLNKLDLVDGKMGASAYQAAEVLAHHKNFKEVSVDKEHLKDLPAGCVIVWDRNYAGAKSSDLHGHIGVTLGDGREASDHVANRTYMLNAKHRVFVPVGIDKSA